MLKQCHEFAGKLISRLSLLFLIAVVIRTVLLLPVSSVLPGAIALQLFIGLLFFMRARAKKPLFFIPDEFLVTLPYFWSISLLGPVINWLPAWLMPLMIVFALSSMQVVEGGYGFAGGLKNNSLLQAAAISVFFVLFMLTFLLKALPAFDLELYRRVMLQLFSVCVGIPISLSAFYKMLPIKK